MLQEVSNFHKREVAKLTRYPIFYDRKKKQFVGIDSDLREQLANRFPRVDIDREIQKMIAWLEFRGTRHRGTLSFITRWLSNSKDLFPVAKEKEIIIDENLKHYLGELWKTPRTQALLMMNQRTSVTPF